MRVASSVRFGIAGPAGDLTARARVQVRVGCAGARGHPRARTTTRMAESGVHVGHVHAARAAHIGAHRIQSAGHVSTCSVALKKDRGKSEK